MEANLTYLLCLGQVSAHKDLPPILKELKRVPNRQNLMTLHMALDNTTCCLNVRVPIVATPGLLKLTLSQDFDWTTGTTWSQAYTSLVWASTLPPPGRR